MVSVIGSKKYESWKTACFNSLTKLFSKFGSFRGILRPVPPDDLAGSELAYGRHSRDPCIDITKVFFKHQYPQASTDHICYESL